MTTEELLTLYRQSSGVRSVLAHLQQENSGQALHLKGLSGSQDAFVAATVVHAYAGTHLFVLDNKEEAAYFQNNLSALLGKKEVLFLPDSCKRPRQFEETNAHNCLLRTEAANRIVNSATSGEVVVTYPEALFEKVVKAAALQEHSLRVKTGEPLDVDFMIDLLVEFQFERVDFVYEPGQFSIRGGIVDVFSFGNEHPYRIELNDEVVESLRTFDPMTQLSVRKIASVNIVPNIQSHFESSNKTSLFELLPATAVVWIKDTALVIDVLSTCAEKWQQYAASNSKPETGTTLSENDLERAADFAQALNRFRIVEFGSRAFQKYVRELVFQSKPQPSFNKNFNLLIETLRNNEAAGYTNLIFSDNKKQIERFYAIFEDLKADVKFQPVMHAIHSGFTDEEMKLACYTDHQIFNRYHKYQLRQGYSRDRAMMMKMLRELKPGDYVTHIDHGVGVYSGLEKIEIAGQVQEAVRLVYMGNDLLYVGIQSLHKISKYVGKEGTEPRVNKLGTDTWENLKRKTKKKIKEIAFDLIQLYAKRKATKGFAFAPDTFLQTELEASFMYEDTPDQAKATEEVKRDMEKPTPMDRLVCGDVGFGKTEIAMRAAMKAVADGKQVAVLVPTTILALQHYKSFKERFADFPVEIDYLNRFKSAKEKTETLKKLESGKTNIIIGTHGLVGKRVKFKDLGLMVIDEEQKFGVGVKETLKNMRANIDSLTLTATPIPRTLQFSMMGARDLSIINTPPPNRQPITTELAVLNPDTIKEAIEFEVYRGGQVFFVHNRVRDIGEVKDMLMKIVPNIEIGVAHGQMEGDHLEEVIMKFINREYDVLLCTNIIESGIDIPNANTIIINNAHQFGLSDLHQLRGRVGRSNKNAFCYLLSPPMHSLTNEARQRLRTVEEFSDLGSGFNISMRDLDIRGAGNMLGAEQSGFIAEIGYDVYQKILDEAIRELKNSDFKELYTEELNEKQEYVSDATIETDVEMRIPDEYVKSSSERMLLYRDLNEVTTEDGLNEFEVMLRDRFGPVPQAVHTLFNAMRLKWLAVRLGMERVILKNNKLRCYFIGNQQSAFYASDLFSRIIAYVSQHHQGVYLRETDKNLVLNFDGVNSMQQSMKCLTELETSITSAMAQSE